MPAASGSPARPSSSSTPIGQGGITFHPLMHGPGGLLRGVAVDARAIDALQSSFRAIACSGEAFAADFYDRLFARRPAFRPMFPADLSTQRPKLLQALEAMVEGLRDPETVRARLRELGRRHLDYGVRPEHYPPVCDCLVEAMRHAAAGAWSETIEQEWRRALELVSAIMIEGASASEPPGQPGAGGPPVRLDG